MCVCRCVCACMWGGVRGRSNTKWAGAKTESASSTQRGVPLFLLSASLGPNTPQLSEHRQAACRRPPSPLHRPVLLDPPWPGPSAAPPEGQHHQPGTREHAAVTAPPAGGPQPALVIFISRLIGTPGGEINSSARTVGRQGGQGAFPSLPSRRWIWTEFLTEPLCGWEIFGFFCYL